MRCLGRTWTIALLVALAAPAAAAAQSTSQDPAYALANGCYTLHGAAGDEAYRMKPTDLGRYLFYTRAGTFLSDGDQGVTTASQPSESTDWRVAAVPGGFAISLPSVPGKALAVGDGGKLVMAGDGTRFAFDPAQGCAEFPEVGLSATGTPGGGATPFGETQGFVDAHMHMMAFEFLGGRAHCGKPWDCWGVTVALVDCPDHYPNGAAAVLETGVSHNPGVTHDPVGWPTFKDWPSYHSLTHEQSYYRWVHRAWMGGLRMYVNLFVENKVLCEVYPYKKNSCDEMDAVRLQAKDIYKMQDYIDAQAGGPGKGFFRIVKDPFEARRVVNDGKLAVVLGIEVSEPFDCQVVNDRPTCDDAQIDRDLDEVYGLGVRDMEIINKFDNALAGVAGDNGSTGAIVNNGNKIETGKYWQMQTCSGTQEGVNDREQPTPFTHNTDALIGNGLQALLPSGTLPVYPAPPHCNQRGLTALGEHAIRGLIARKMIVDPDHLSVLARNQVLSILDGAAYPGVVSSHSWSTADAFPRIYQRGGFVAPYAGSSGDFVKAWRTIKPMRDPRYYWGIGYGADMNCFGAQGAPRLGATNAVACPFKSFDGNVTLDRLKSGERVYDINVDGVAHYGLYPDWVQDLRMIAGDEIVNDLARGSEAYLQMWERAVGVPEERCQPARARFGSGGLARWRLGDDTTALLRSAGQPLTRPGRVWSYCLQARDKRAPGGVKVVLTPDGKVGLVVSTGAEREARGIGTGDRMRGSGPRRRGRYVYGRRSGRVSYV